MSNSISNKYFSPSQLRTIQNSYYEAMGQTDKIMKEKPSSESEGARDVLVLAPEDSGGLFKSTDASSVSEILDKRGVEVSSDLKDIGAAAKLSSSQIDEMEAMGFKVFDDSPRDMIPALPKNSSFQAELSSKAVAEGKKPWDAPDIKAVEWLGSDKLQSEGFDGSNTVVAVLDSGFNHAPYNDKLAGFKDTTDLDAKKPHDLSGHGTHVAHDVLMTAPNAKILAVKVMGDDGRGRNSDIIEGIQYAVEQKLSGKLDVDIINMSLGAGPDGFPDTWDPINRAVKKAKEAGITVIVAGGNSGPDARTIGSPGDSVDAITVGATLNDNIVSDFSSRGPTDDGLVKPDVMAPGEYIAGWSAPGSEMEQMAKAYQGLRDMDVTKLRSLVDKNPALLKGLGLDESVVDKPDSEFEKEVKVALPPVYFKDGKILAPGTSFASPLVAGIAAQLEEKSDQTGHDLTPEETKELLTSTARPMGTEDGNVEGAGFVQADVAGDKIG